MPSNSEYHGYEIPDDGEQNWGDPLQRTLQALDRDTVIRRATASDIRDETPTNDALAIARDSERVFIGTDTAWLELDTLGPDPEVTSLDADENLSLPVRTDNSTVAAEDGQVWFNDGSGPDGAGVYYYDADTGIIGPVGEGSGSAPASLSGLTIDTTKDFDGFSLTGLGHDEVDVPQTFDLTVDDFERASLGPEYVGDTDDAQIQSSVALEGERSLAISRSSAGASFVGSVRDSVPQFGDSFEIKLRLTDTDDTADLNLFVSDPSTQVTNGTGVEILSDAKFDNFRVRSYVGGSVSGGAITNASISNFLNETLTVTGEVTLEGSLSVRLLDSTGSDIASLTHSIADEISPSGAVQFNAKNGSTPPTVYFDGPFIKRRVPQETRERQRGSTETSKLQTRGGVGAGPRILPENRAAAVMADQGVTSDVPQGTEVGYSLQLNGRKMLELRGEADGNGGLQQKHIETQAELGGAQHIPTDRLTLTDRGNGITEIRVPIGPPSDATNLLIIDLAARANLSGRISEEHQATVRFQLTYDTDSNFGLNKEVRGTGVTINSFSFDTATNEIVFEADTGTAGFFEAFHARLIQG